MDNINIRKAGKKDSGRIWEIRNHPKMRAVSNNTGVIEFEKHDKWFNNKYFAKDRHYCFVIEDDNAVFGYCRFDYDEENDNYIISIALDPEKSGSGLGSLFLKQAIEKSGIDKEIIAQALKGNEISKNFFAKNGFNLFEEDDNNYYLKYKR